MSTSLVHLTNRPSAVHVGSCAVMINIHDQWFTAEYKRLRNLVIGCHPDRRGFTLLGVKRKQENQIVPCKYIYPQSTSAFHRAQAQLKTFLQTELRWYEQYGLLPPTKQRITKEPLPEKGGLRFKNRGHLQIKARPRQQELTT